MVEPGLEAYVISGIERGPPAHEVPQAPDFQEPGVQCDPGEDQRAASRPILQASLLEGLAPPNVREEAREADLAPICPE